MKSITRRPVPAADEVDAVATRPLKASTAPAPTAGTRTFRVRCVAGDGTVVNEIVGGSDEADVLARLRERGLRPIRVRPDRRSILNAQATLPGFGPKVKPEDLAAIARQFATMNRAGVPLLRTLEVLGTQATGALGTALDAVRGDVAGGVALSDAAAAHPQVFDPLTVALLQAGEASGALDEVLDQIAETLERRALLRRILRSALAYPAAVLIMVAGVVVAMLAFVIPTFSGIYDDLGGTLPAPTRALLFTSDLFTDHMVALGIGFTLLVIGLRAWRSTRNGRYRIDSFVTRLPGLGPVVTKAGLARIGGTMAVLSRAGVPVLEALRITADSAGNAVLGRAVDQVRSGVENGATLAESFAASPVIPPMVVQLIAVGEESGTLDDVLGTIASTYATDVEATVSSLASVIEPILMAFIGIVVGGMVVALYLPMFDVIDLVQ